MQAGSRPGHVGADASVQGGGLGQCTREKYVQLSCTK